LRGLKRISTATKPKCLCVQKFRVGWQYQQLQCFCQTLPEILKVSEIVMGKDLINLQQLEGKHFFFR